MAEGKPTLPRPVSDLSDDEAPACNTHQSQQRTLERQNSILVKKSREKTLTRSVSFYLNDDVKEKKEPEKKNQLEEKNVDRQPQHEEMEERALEWDAAEDRPPKALRTGKKRELKTNKEIVIEKESKEMKKTEKMVDTSRKTTAKKGKNNDLGKKKVSKRRKRDKKEPSGQKGRKSTKRHSGGLKSRSACSNKTEDSDCEPTLEGLLQLSREPSGEVWDGIPSLSEQFLPPVDLFSEPEDSCVVLADEQHGYVERRHRTEPSLVSSGSDVSQEELRETLGLARLGSATVLEGRATSSKFMLAAPDRAGKEEEEEREDDKKPVTLKGVVGKMKLNFRAFGTGQDCKKALPVVQGLANSSEHEYGAAVDGIHRFGISKMGLARAVVRFCSGSPVEKGFPLTLCFQFPSGYLTHRYVLDMVRLKLQKLEGRGKVTSIQYVNRNVIHGTRGLDHRWLVVLNCAEARDELLSRGLHLFSRRVALRPYDDILRAEYREYQQYMELKKAMFRITGESQKERSKSRAQLPRTPSTRDMGALESKAKDSGIGEERSIKGGSGREKRLSSGGERQQ